MRQRVLVIQATWDDEARVWVAESEDVPGLVTEAATVEELARKLRTMVPELLMLNRHLLDSDDSDSELLLELTARQALTLPPIHGGP
ncbi:MAG TPA: DUF1902 domain-containing protein [Geminicoccaceae bacterium]|nr:DUF1902 domain-containing protein [Geminicoccaceae bacterium]